MCVTLGPAPALLSFSFWVLLSNTQALPLLFFLPVLSSSPPFFSSSSAHSPNPSSLTQCFARLKCLSLSICTLHSSVSFFFLPFFGLISISSLPLGLFSSYMSSVYIGKLNSVAGP